MPGDVTFTSRFEGREGDIAQLFADTFAASEGAEEGALIGNLARDLMRLTPSGDLFVFAAENDGTIVGSIVFSRLTYPEDARTVFVLGPVAVRTDVQGQGVGQGLLRHGLAQLTAAGVDVAVTYGDPKYYSKVGFAPVAEDFAAPPFRLRFPEGWLAQSLSDRRFSPLRGACTCVKAFDDPVFW